MKKQSLAILREYLKKSIPKHLIKKYRIQVSNCKYRYPGNSELTLHGYLFINVRIDENFNISESETTITISNKKLIVSLWKNTNVTPHITVFY